MASYCPLCHPHVENTPHCFGKMEGCDCSCAPHTLPEDDIRNDMIVILGLEAHQEHDVLKTVIAQLSEDRVRSVLAIMTKYAMWMVREAGMDPVKMVQSTALYWSGGEPDKQSEM